MAIEVKSKHRSGILHQIGLPAPLEKLLSVRKVRRLFNDALGQNPEDVPFAVFIDVNSPLTPQIPIDDKPWVKEAQRLVADKLIGVAPQEYPLSVAVFTNFSYHYQTEQEAEQGESVTMLVPNPKFPPPNSDFFNALKGALRHHGWVPPIDLDGTFDKGSGSEPIEPTQATP